MNTEINKLINAIEYIEDSPRIGCVFVINGKEYYKKDAVNLLQGEIKRLTEGGTK